MDTTDAVRITNIDLRLADGSVTTNATSNINAVFMINLDQPRYQEYSQIIAISYEELEGRRFRAIDKARLLVYDRLVEVLRKNGYVDGTYLVGFAVTKDDTMRTINVAAYTKVDTARQYERGSQVTPLARDTSYKVPDKIEGELKVRRNIIITGEK